jgi:hypothetical protein
MHAKDRKETGNENQVGSWNNKIVISTFCPKSFKLIKDN